MFFYKQEPDSNNNLIETFSKDLYYFKTIDQFFTFFSENVSLSMYLKTFKRFVEEIIRLERNNKNHTTNKLKKGYIEIKNDCDQLFCSVAFQKNIRKSILEKTNKLVNILVTILSEKLSSVDKKDDEIQRFIELEILAKDVIKKIFDTQLSLDKIIEHPLFWTAIEKIEFFKKINEYIKIDAKPIKINKFNNSNTNSCGLEQGSLETLVISSDMYGEVEINGKIINIQKIKHHREEFKKMKTVENFLKFFRNMWEHADDKQYLQRGEWLGYKEADGKVDPYIFWKNITQPWPSLLLDLFNIYHKKI